MINPTSLQTVFTWFNATREPTINFKNKSVSIIFEPWSSGQIEQWPHWFLKLLKAINAAAFNKVGLIFDLKNAYYNNI